MGNQRDRLRAEQQTAQRTSRMRRIVIAAAAVLALVVVGVFVTVAMQQPPADGGANTADVPYPPSATAARDGIIVNDNAGKPEVGLYFDYQCSHCVQFERSFGGALDLLGSTGEIKLVHHTRIFMDRGDTSGLSHRAALAAACSDVVGKYAQYHAAIFSAASDGPYTDQLFTETIPAKVGITGTDLTALTACYANQNLAAFVQGVDDAAGKAGINQTPTMTVNGKPVPIDSFQGKTGDDLKAIIDAAAKG